MAQLFADNLASFSARVATLNVLNAGLTAAGSFSDLVIAGSASLFVNSASNVVFTGPMLTNTGIIRSTASASTGLTLSTVSGDLTVSPAGIASFSKELTTTQGKISSTGTGLTLEAKTGDITLSSPGVLALNSHITTSDGRISSTNPSGMTLSTTASGASFTLLTNDGDVFSNGNFNTSKGWFASSASSGVALVAERGAVHLWPLDTTGDTGIVSRTGIEFRDKAFIKTHADAGALTISTGAGGISLNPFTGQSLSTNALFSTSNGNIQSTHAGGMTVSTTAGGIALNPASGSSVNTNAAVSTSHGTVTSTASGGLTLATSVGGISLQPLAGQNVNANAPIVTSNGAISSSNASGLTLTASASNAPVTVASSKELAVNCAIVSSNGTFDATHSMWLRCTGPGNIFLDATAAGNTISSRPIYTWGGIVGALGSASLTLMTSTGGGDVRVEPTPGKNFITNAKFVTSNGAIEGTSAMTVSTTTGAINLQPSTSLNTNALFSTSHGTIQSTNAGGMTVSTTAGGIALNPLAGQNVTTNARLRTSNGNIESTTNLSLVSGGGIVFNVSGGAAGGNRVVSDASAVQLWGTHILGSNTAGLTIEADNGASAAINLNAPNGLNTNTHFNTSHGRISATGTNGMVIRTTTTTGTGNIQFWPSMNGHVSTRTGFVTEAGYLTSSASTGLTVSNQSGGHMYLNPGPTTSASWGLYTNAHTFFTSGSKIKATGASGLALDVDSSNLAVNVPGGNANFFLGSGYNVYSDKGFATGNGQIISASSSGMSLLNTAGGPIALQPFAGQDVSTTGRLVTSNGNIHSTASAGLTVSTAAGGMTLNPFSTMTVTKDTTFTTGNITSGGTSDLTLSSASGRILVNGDLDVQGEINAVSTNYIQVADKTVNLSHMDTGASNANADLSGLIIEGTAFAATPGSTDLSLIWNNNAGGVPHWTLSGGDFYVQRKNSTGDLLTFQFVIDESNNALVLKRTVNGANLKNLAVFA